MSKLQRTKYPSFTNARINLHKHGFKRPDILIPLFFAAAAYYGSDNSFLDVEIPTLEKAQQHCLDRHIYLNNRASTKNMTVNGDSYVFEYQTPPSSSVSVGKIQDCAETYISFNKYASNAIDVLSGLAGGIAGLGIAFGLASFRKKRKISGPSAPSA